MKMTQAWAWLAAGVLAAGLNASYHDGGLQWAHQVADRVEHGSAAVLALASGRADQFLAEARLLTARDETASCPWATTLARVESRVDRSQAGWDVMSAREEAQQARWEANRARMEARIAARTAHLRIATMDFAPITFRAVAAPVICPRIRVNVPRLPTIQAPVIHIDTASTGPV